MSSVPIFNHPAWLDLTTREGQWSDVQVRGGNDELIGRLPFVHRRRFGLPSVEMPVFTPLFRLEIRPSRSTNSYKRYGHADRVVARLLEQLPPAARTLLMLDYEFDQWLPFARAGFGVRLHYSYLLDLTIPEPDRLQQCHAPTRRLLQRVPQQSLEFSVIDPRRAYSIYIRHLNDRGAPIPVDAETFYKICAETDLWRFHNYAALIDGEVVAVIGILIDGPTAYYMLSARDEFRDREGILSRLLWQSHRTLSEMGVETFDFEGSMLPGVEEFFRSFGGERVKKYLLKKWDPWFWR